MRHAIIAALFLIVLQGLIALDLKVESFSYDPLDLTAISKPIKDYNGDKCSALRVETNVIPELYISGQEIFEKRKVTPSEYYFFLSFRSSMVTFSAEGYTPLYYQIPLRMEPGLVYKVVLKSIGVDPNNAVNITIISDPPDAEKWLDGELLGTERGFLVQPGEHKLEVKKDGYGSVHKEITVTKENFVFDNIKLQQVEDEQVTIKSEPSGAEVYLNGMRRGVTEAQLYLFPGKYRLKLILSGHFELEEDIEIKANAKNEFNYKLKRNYATVQFRVTPSDAKVFVSREEIVGNRIELVNGAYSVEVKREGYDDYRESITVVAGQDRTIGISLTQQTGTVTFEINPSNAKAILTRDEKTVKQWSGTNRLTDLPVGDYSISVSASGYKSAKQVFKLKKDERLTKSIYLQEGVEYDNLKLYKRTLGDRLKSAFTVSDISGRFKFGGSYIYCLKENTQYFGPVVLGFDFHTWTQSGLGVGLNFEYNMNFKDESILDIIPLYLSCVYRLKDFEMDFVPYVGLGAGYYLMSFEDDEDTYYGYYEDDTHYSGSFGLSVMVGVFTKEYSEIRGRYSFELSFTKNRYNVGFRDVDYCQLNFLIGMFLR